MKFIFSMDSSQIKQFMICPLSWYLQYQVNPEIAGSKNLKLKTAYPKGGGADKGTYVHKLNDVFFSLRAAQRTQSSQAHAHAAMEFIKTAGTADALGIGKDDERFLLERFLQFVLHHDSRKDELIPIKDPEGNPGVEVPFSKVLFEDADRMYIVEGRIDLLCMLNRGQVKAWADHKTQSRFNDLYHWKPQFLTYAWATGFNYGLINYIGLQQKINANTFRYVPIEFPEWKIEEWADKMLQCFRVIEEGLTGPIDPLQYFYNRKIEASCGGAFESTPCMFTKLCEIEPWNQRLKDFVMEREFELVEKWQPWKLEVEEA